MLFAVVREVCCWPAADFLRPSLSAMAILIQSKLLRRILCCKSLNKADGERVG